jgi:hypothetical protein
VDAKWRTQGVGKQLLERATQAARAGGASQVTLEAHPQPGTVSPSVLMNFYRRLGFTASGFSQRGNPVMVKSLGAARPPSQLQAKLSPVRPVRGLTTIQQRPVPARQVPSVVQRMWSPNSSGYTFNPGPTPLSYSFTSTSAFVVTQPIPQGTISSLTSRTRRSGVEEGEVGSYAVVQYLEKTGDKLTGDHQPSGAAVKEAIRQALHLAKSGPLTRLQARYAYQKAIGSMYFTQSA